MKNRKYEKVTNNKIAVKGELSADCSYIIFINDDKEEEKVQLAKYLRPFAGQEITFILSNKITEDLDEEFEDEE